MCNLLLLMIRENPETTRKGKELCNIHQSLVEVHRDTNASTIVDSLTKNNGSNQSKESTCLERYEESYSAHRN